jgi:hypothetical protein
MGFPIFRRPVLVLILSTALAGLAPIADSAAASDTDPLLLERFDELREHIEEVVPEPGLANSFIAKVDAARAALERGQPCVALNQLEAVINEAEASALPPDVGDDLAYRGLLLQGDFIASLPSGTCPGFDPPPVCLDTAPWPDLAVTEVTADPDQIFELEGSVVMATIANRGGVEAAASVAFSEEEVLFASTSTDVVEPCGELTITGFWPGGDLGPHHLDVFVDPDGALSEGTRLNNAGSVEVLVVFERDRPWEPADLTLTALSPSNRRPLEGELVTIEAVVTNDGDDPLSGVVVSFAVDGEEIATAPLDEISAAGSVAVTAEWQATPGRHVATAEAAMPSDRVERNSSNNIASIVLHGAGAADPLPDIVVESLTAAPASSVLLTATFTNIGWADAFAVPLVFTIDGVAVADATIDLAAGEQTTVDQILNADLDCDHVVAVEIDPDRVVPRTDAPGTFGALVRAVDPSFLCAGPQWTERGPSSLSNGWTGRIDSLAIDPDHPDTMYAGASTGGVWKTTDGGTSGGWVPLTDRMETMNTSALLLDPTDPSILYVGTDQGLFKTTNGGTTFTKFADATVGTRFVDLLFVDHGGAGFDLYAAGNKGVWRHTGTDHAAPTSDATTEWMLVKSGEVTDLVRHPTDDTRFWVATATDRNGKLYESKPGGPPSGDASWDDRTGNIPETGIIRIQFDLSAADPDVMYAGLHTEGTYHLYRSGDGGGSWAPRFSNTTEIRWVEPTVASIGGYYENFYNDYVVADPEKPDTVYMGHIQAYRSDNGGTTLFRVQGIHDDQHGFTREPGNPSVIYFTGDGGVFRCSDRGNVCANRNTGLATFQFYDIAVAADADRVVGGTQDNGTIRTDGFTTWDLIRGGDGRYVAIDPTDHDVVYSQNQYLGDTRKTVDAFTAAQPGWRETKGLPPTKGDDAYVGDPFMRLHPTDNDVLFGAWTEVARHSQVTEDWTACPDGAGCTGFSTIGPTAAKGSIKRIVVDPATGRYYAGTSKGAVWVSENAGSTWTKVFTHGTSRAVTGIAPDPHDSDVVWLTFEGAGTTDGPLRVWRLERIVSDDVSPGPLVTWAKTNLTKNLPLGVDLGQGWRQSNMIAVDPTSTDVVYVGTSSGVFRGTGVITEAGFSFSWMPLTCGIPNVRIVDLEIHEATKVLYAATWGRGLWTTSLVPARQ